MRCEQVREALSAGIDGEDPGVEPAALARHLTGCPACAAWRVQAERVTRAARLQPVRVPDLTADVLAAVAADPAARRPRRGAVDRRPARTVLRVAVAVAAFAQAVLALSVLLGADLHTSREIACFELALAVGFALAAWRPERAGFFVPVAGVLAVGLALTSAVDVAHASAALVHEAAHLAAVVQAGLLWALARSSDPPGAGTVAGPATTAA